MSPASRLYTDDEEVLFKAARPTLLNGIEDIIGRSDLADRAIFLTLAPIGEEQRRSETGLSSADIAVIGRGAGRMNAEGDDATVAELPEGDGKVAAAEGEGAGFGVLGCDEKCSLGHFWRRWCA